MELLTTKQAADELGITVNRMRQLCQDGRIGRKIGRQWLITRDELEAFKKLNRSTGFRYPDSDE